MKSPMHLWLGLSLVMAAQSALAVPLATQPYEQCAETSARSMAGYAVPAQKSTLAQHAAMRELNDWLRADAALPAKAAGPTLPLDRSDRFQLGLEACADCGSLQSDPRRFLVGVGKPLGLAVDFTRLGAKAARFSGRFAEGAVGYAADGGRVWTLKLASPGAAGLRVGLSGLKLPKSAALYVFNERGEAFGPYHDRGINRSGEVVTNMLSGDSLRLQLHVADPAELKAVRFTVDELAHISPRFDLARRIDAAYDPSKVHCTEGIVNANCVENAACFNSADYAPIDDVRKAIGAMLFRSGGGYYICTGGLIANDAGDPLFLTANHCISKGNEANSLEVYWNHTVPCGETSCSGAWVVQGRASEVGASILATSRSGDFNLMRLNSSLAPGAFALGWSSTPVANVNNTALYRISHPQGAPQAFSAQVVNTQAGTCGTLPRGNYIYSTDSSGATEGGSSGSPVLNAAGEIVGQLYGACGSNLNDVCDSGSNRTVDGAFAAYFTQVEAFLVGGGGPGDPGAGFNLSGNGSKQQGRWVADLSWSGSTAASIDIRRDGSLIDTVSNTGSYRDSTSFRGGGSLSYQVCEAGSSVCSNTITLNF